MLVELDAGYYPTVLPLCAGMFERAGVQSVLCGKRQSRTAVFVDGLEKPTAALVCHVGNYYVFGALYPPLLRFILDAPIEQTIFTRPFFNVYPDGAWEEVLLAVCPHFVQVIPRMTYRVEAAEATALSDWRDRLPPGAQVMPLDRTLAERVDRELGDQYIGPLWTEDEPRERYPAEGYENFAQQSFGFCMLLDGRLVCVFWAFGRGEDAASVDVETAEAYRGRGLATITGGAWLEYCRAHGLASEWICDEVNTASAKLALKLGHKPVRPVKQLLWRDWGGVFSNTVGRWVCEPHPAGSVWRAVS